MRHLIVVLWLAVMRIRDRTKHALYQAHMKERLYLERLHDETEALQAMELMP